MGVLIIKFNSFNTNQLKLVLQYIFFFMISIAWIIKVSQISESGKGRIIRRWKVTAFREVLMTGYFFIFHNIIFL
jgi:hypothetical protein